MRLARPQSFRFAHAGALGLAVTSIEWPAALMPWQMWITQPVGLNRDFSSVERRGTHISMRAISRRSPRRGPLRAGIPVQPLPHRLRMAKSSSRGSAGPPPKPPG
jgi:hypothetical protein